MTQKILNDYKKVGNKLISPINQILNIKKTSWEDNISAHNSWTHLFRFNLKPCNNPLHGTHYVGKINEDTPGFIHYLNLITKYMKKTLALFDENIKIDLSEIKDAYEVLWNDFDNLVSKLDKKGS